MFHFPFLIANVWLSSRPTTAQSWVYGWAQHGAYSWAQSWAQHRAGQPFLQQDALLAGHSPTDCGKAGVKGTEGSSKQLCSQPG